MPSRLQLALNVTDIDQAVAFYSKLFGAEPAKVRPGYANFAIAEPPLKLVLLENPGRGGSLNHLGVEVADTGRGRIRAGAPGRGRAGRGGSGRDHLLLRQAGQVLGPGRTRQRGTGDLHGSGRQPHLLRRRPRRDMLRRHRRPHRGDGRFRGPVLLAAALNCHARCLRRRER